MPNGGGWNPSVVGGNQVILARGTINTETLRLTTHSSTHSSVAVTPTTAIISAGGSTTIPTTSVECDGTTINVKPSLTFPDATVQTTAWTGFQNSPSMATFSGFVYTGASLFGPLLTFDMSSMTTSAKELGYITLRITTDIQWSLQSSLNGSSVQYYNAYSKGQYIVKIYPGRLPSSSDWSPSNNRCRWINNTGGTRGTSPYPITAGDEKTPCIWTNNNMITGTVGSTLPSYSFIQPVSIGGNYQNIQFCMQTFGFVAPFTLQIETLGYSPWYTGSMSVDFSYASSGSTNNNVPNLY